MCETILKVPLAELITRLSQRQIAEECFLMHSTYTWSYRVSQFQFQVSAKNMDESKIDPGVEESSLLSSGNEEITQ